MRPACRVESSDLRPACRVESSDLGPACRVEPEEPTVLDDPAVVPALSPRFTVRLENFEGPFDLLLQLISQQQMDVTEVALHRVTDEFIAHLRLLGESFDLDETTEFLVIAATLLDLKAARLLPEVLLGVDAARFAETAAAVFRPKPPPPTVSLEHLHAPRVSVHEHAAVLRGRLAREGEASFHSLVADCAHIREVVARFLALLELYRSAVVVFDQTDPLGDLHVRWTGGAEQTAIESQVDGEEDEDYR